eukprot:COSAG06_NODE_9749_length_1827_cov_59.484375_2_plen_134_part_00
MYDAAGANDLARVLERLRQGAELEWRSGGGGLTPLAIACDQGSYEAAEALCAHGAELDTRSNSQGTPLMLAAYPGYPKVCAMLLALGADPSLKDKEGKTALDYARQKGFRESAETTARKPECVALLQPVTPSS